MHAPICEPVRRSDSKRHRNGLSITLAFVTSILLLHGSLSAQSQSNTPNDFFKRGTPTFVVGTAGDDRADRTIRAQAGMIRDLLFPAAKIIDDVAVDAARGSEAWPANPVLYGGPHVNHVLMKLGASLPFRMELGKLTLGGHEAVGDMHRLISLVPAQAADKNGPGYPQFLLYAGTGSPGVAEINSVRHGSDAILIADEFGRVLSGTWQKSDNDGYTPVFVGQRAARIPWRSVNRELRTGATTIPAAVHVRFPQQLPAAKDEEQVIQACLRGLAQAVEKTQIVSSADLTVYVYPDLGSIASLTGQRGDGHAVVESRVLHVVRTDPSAGGSFESLLAHEGTHAIAYDTWEAAGTPMLGEGLAVWAAESYGGISLSEWNRRVQRPIPTVIELLGKSFRQIPENQSYPLAGIFVATAVEKLGIAKVRQHLYGATSSTWQTACSAAGTTPQELETAFQAAFAK